MPEPLETRVFISWSGDLAKAVAKALYEWLPVVSDHVTPWMSAVNIGAGQRSLQEIDAALQGARFGVVVVTAANQHSQWLNYEAGAMAKAVGVGVEHEQRVVPLLVDLEKPTDVSGPIGQFQGTVFSQDGMRQIVQSMVEVSGGDPAPALKRFDLSWPELEAKVAAAREQGTEPAPVARSDRDLLEEALGILRGFSLMTSAPTWDDLAGKSRRIILTQPAPDPHAVATARASALGIPLLGIVEGPGAFTGTLGDAEYILFVERNADPLVVDLLRETVGRDLRSIVDVGYVSDDPGELDEGEAQGAAES